MIEALDSEDLDKRDQAASDLRKFVRSFPNQVLFGRVQKRAAELKDRSPEVVNRLTDLLDWMSSLNFGRVETQSRTIVERKP